MIRVLQNCLIEASQESGEVVVIIIYNLPISGNYKIDVRQVRRKRESQAVRQEKEIY